MQRFGAFVLTKAEKGQSLDWTEIGEADLMDGDVTVAVSHSTVNYKDGLALTGKIPIIRKFPLIPGIDFSGKVVASTNPDWKPGDRVVFTSYAGEQFKVGENELLLMHEEDILAIID